jgi:GNAT superfamily N-acetyltransferase
MNTPLIAKTDEDISRCFAVIAELRPHLDERSFVSTVRGMQAGGYQLVYVLDADSVVAAAGYRIHTTLFMGRNLYIDDLVTSSRYRSNGYGKILIDWLRNAARESACTHLHLDSGTQRHRAHRFYLRQGMDIESFHFSEKLDEA